MEKFSSLFIYKYNHSELAGLFSNALKALGFEPTYMDVYINEDEILNDVTYSEEMAFTLLNRGATSILIKKQLHDEFGDNYWFKLSIDKIYYHTVTFQWVNNNLDFLINSNWFNNFLNTDSLFCGYCYNLEDCFLQSNEDISYYKLMMEDIPFKAKKNQFGDAIIDVSEHWGRSEKACGLEFMAAPLMWFGESFFTIITKQELLSFKYGVITQCQFENIVFIKLFYLYALPSEDENRIKQEKFWLFFGLKEKINSYAKSHSIDLDQWVKDQMLLKKKKKK